MPSMPQNKLIFLISSPRSGSTLLQRMLGSHTQIFTHPEPHLLTPLYYLGYYNTVDKAPYDHINAAQALREFVQELPHGEEDYLDALRAYSNTIYQRVLAPTGKRLFLDKTPAYALILPFLMKLYPKSKYVVLTRHPMAIAHSYAHSFFAGDYLGAHAKNPIVTRYVPAIGEFLREQGSNLVRTRYEDLVNNPRQELQRIFEHLQIPFEPDTIEYGKHQHITKSYGDPMSVERHQTPVTTSLNTWAQDLLAKPEILEFAKELVEELNPDDLNAWGYPKESFFDALQGQVALETRASAFNSYRIKRQALSFLRRHAQDNTMATTLRKIRYYCDVILRA
ncbi:MAG: sulfotransferase [Myxococcota bacterium]